MSILDKFTVVDLIKSRSSSVATITGSMLKFNTQTAVELGYPPYIQILINAKDRQLAIRVCQKDAANAVHFSKHAGEQRYPIRISSMAVTGMIRKLAGWSAEDNWNIPGVLFADEQAIVYDLTTAYKPMVKGQRKGIDASEEVDA